MSPLEWLGTLVGIGVICVGFVVALLAAGKDPEWPAPKCESESQRRIRAAHRDWTHRS